MTHDKNGDSMFALATTAWEKGKVRDAFRLFKAAAEAGHASSQHNLAYFFDVGEGVRRDSNKALYWYKRAWRSDRQTSSCSNIATIYAEQGNTRLAVAWWKKAVEKGDGDAALDMAKFLMANDRGASQRKAALLLRRAANAKRITKAGAAEARRLLRQAEK